MGPDARPLSIPVLFGANLTLLFSHQTEAAWWGEWEMVGLSCGIQLFVLLNAAFLVLGLVGYGAVLQNKRKGPLFSLILCAVGTVVPCIHLGFYLTGDARFNLPLSYVILALMVACSFAQGERTFAWMRSRRAG